MQNKQKTNFAPQIKLHSTTLTPVSFCQVYPLKLQTAFVWTNTVTSHETRDYFHP